MKQKEYAFGIHAIKNLLQLRSQDITQLFVQTSRHDQRLDELLELATQHNISVTKLARKKLDELTQSTHHQGIAAEIKGSLLYQEQHLQQLMEAATESLLLLILDGVQDPHNFGACLRSADAFAVDAVLIPKDRAVGITPTVRKVACGAAETVPVIQVTNLARSIRWLKEQGVWLVGTSDKAEVLLRDVDLSGNIGIIMGSESTGMRRLTAECCDFLVQIPMNGVVESLNVSVATGICLYEVSRQR